MKHKPLDIYDDMPTAMKAYISNYGFHFSKKACEFAVSLLRKNGQKIQPYSKEQVEEMLRKYSLNLDKAVMYDPVYVANMAKADYYGSSIADEIHLAKFIRDYIEDEDASDEVTFRRWLATMVGNGIPIEWEDIL